MPLIRPGRILLSFKLYLAAMLALGIAFVRGFDYPYWTMMVVYILALDSTAAMRQKWLYMLAGTLTGAGAGMLASILFSLSEPVIFGAMMVLISVTTFFAVGNRLPKFYGFLMAGTTCLLVAMPGITTPDLVWLRVVDRVQDLMVGAFILFIVDTLLLVHTSRDELGAVVDGWLAHLRGLCVAALRGEAWEHGPPGRVPPAEGRGDHEAKLIKSVGMIDVLSSYLPFDRLSRGGRRREAAEAIRLRGLRLLPHLYRMGDIDAHRETHGLPRVDMPLREALAGWIEAGNPDAARAALHARLRHRVEVPPDDWDALLVRMQRRCLRGIFALWCLIGAARANLSARHPGRSPLPRRRDATPLVLAHVDLGYRLRIVLGTVLHMATFAVFWNLFDWVSAYAALGLLLSTTFFVVSTRSPAPVPTLLRISRVVAIALGIVFIYVTAILPHTSSMVTVALVLFPALFVLGLVVPDPGNVLFAVLPMALLRLGNNGPAVDLATLLNSVLALAIGLCSALLWMVLVVRLPAGGPLGRVQRESRADLRDVVRGREDDAQAYEQRALDRFLLLAQWAPPAADKPAGPAVIDDTPPALAMREMRIGSELIRVQRRLPDSAWLITAVGRLLSAAGEPGGAPGRAAGTGTATGSASEAPPASAVALDTFLHAAAGLPVFAQALLADLRLALYPHAAPPAPPRADAAGSGHPAPGAPS
ncbi:MAG: FUSC family protein [Burkholderia gladioli]